MKIRFARMNVADDLLDDDLIFHFTSYQNLKAILQSKELRFSSMGNCNDPYEYRTDRGIGFSYVGPFEESDPKDILRYLSDNPIQKYGRILRENCKIACFSCFEEEDYGTNSFLLPFTRPRHWAQYGDVQKGACLVFSKTELIQSIEANLDNHIFRHRRIEYDLDRILWADRQRRHMFEAGSRHPTVEDIMQHIDKYSEFIFFKKFSDFKNENEYRFLMVDQTHEQQIEPYAISIDALKFVILGDNFNRNLLPEVQETCVELDLLLFKLEYSLSANVTLLS